MRRREFIAALGGLAAWPLVVWAQQRAMPVFGILLVFSSDAGRTFTEPIRAYMRALGYIEGRNIAFDFRYADGKAEGPSAERSSGRILGTCARGLQPATLNGGLFSCCRLPRQPCRLMHLIQRKAAGLVWPSVSCLEKLQQNGHGDVAKSRVGSGQNQPISPGSLGSALGPSIVKALAKRTEQRLMASR
jgi:uncharacterized protein YidB (DUF937 family)